LNKEVDMSAMKQWLAAVLLLLPVTTFGAERVALQVDGLGCPFCAFGIEKRLLSLDAVASVDVDLQGGRVVVTLREDATLEEPVAARAVRDAGFTLGGFERLAPAD
jgi:copper chaperone CopZ